MESAEKQNPRSVNSFKKKPGRSRTTSHFKRLGSRTCRSKAGRRSSVSSRKKNNTKYDRGKAYAKLIQTKSQSRVPNGRSTSRSAALYRLKCRRTTQAVYVAKRQYRRRISTVDSQANECSKDISPQANSDEFIGMSTCKIPAESAAIQSFSSSTKPQARLKRKYTRRIPSSRSSSYPRKVNAKNIRSNCSNSAVDFNNLVKKQETFVRAFAIPTHLYRYLSQRHRDRPLYLDRNLSYLMPNPPHKQSSGSRRSINKIVEYLIQKQKDRKQDNQLKDSLSSSSSMAPGEWPQELELIFEGFYDSEKEMDWVTVDASVNVHLRFGWAWRRKICPDDTILNITPNPIRMNCFNHSTGYCSIVNSGSSSPPVPSANNLTSTDKHKQLNNINLANCYRCRFSLTDLMNQVKWNTSSGRLTSAQLELHVSAVERRWLKRPGLSHTVGGLNGITQSITNNLTQQVVNHHHINHNGSNTLKSNTDEKNSINNNHIPFINGNPLRKGGLSSASYPVQYATAPLPLVFSSVGFGLESSTNTSRHLLLTPGLYELRLGVDTSDNGSSNGSISNRMLNQAVPLKCLDDSHNERSDVSTYNQVGGGQVEWRRIRFPNSSTALDEYSRWPRLRFSVVWHHKSQNDLQITSPNRLMENRRQDSPHTYVDGGGRSSLTRSMTNSHNKDVTRMPNQVGMAYSPTVVKESCDSVYIDSTDLDKCLSNRVQQSLSAQFGSDTKSTSTRTPSTIHPITYGFIFGGNLQQWSESTDLVCPWCRLDCARAGGDKGPEALILHLRTCHPRFRFKVIWNPSQTHLTLHVSLNEEYDGSNDCGIRRWSLSGRNIFVLRRHTIPSGQLVGSCTANGTSINGKLPNNQSHHSNFNQIEATVRIRCPVRRLPYTHLIFWRGAELSTDQLLDPTLSVRPMVVGHNRVYYHTRTSQPVRACEFDVDSEAEDSPAWLRQHYQRKVEEFTDVNPGEKQIMQLWNALLLSVRPSSLVVCDSQVLTLVCQFIHQHSRWIHRRRLRTNLLLHLVNLVDYGLLSSGHLRQLMIIYDKHVQESINSPASSLSSTVPTSINSASSGAMTTSFITSGLKLDDNIVRPQSFIPRLPQVFTSPSSSQ
ncbi:Polycomb protein Su(z)12 [Schistosoma japonicum]|nr:Polycomb protein Su(z)12 [Schistosoma japonicum]